MSKVCIPSEFYCGEKQPVALTVGELKQILSQLPDALPLSQDGLNCGAKVVVYNIDTFPFIEFERDERVLLDEMTGIPALVMPEQISDC